MRKWAADGLSYLTLDADVKEKLVDDEAAVKALIELAKADKSQDCAYGVVTVFVNCTNSFEKQEIMPEMLELAKFAKHHIPEEHELDDPDFIDKRIFQLANYGMTSALVALSKTESKNLKELISRVLNATCTSGIQFLSNFAIIHHLFFADDVILVSDTIQGLQNKLNVDL